jgi:hypothetical protein
LLHHSGNLIVEGCQVSHEGFGFRIVRERYREIGIFREPWLRPGRNSQPADERERDVRFVQLTDYSAQN